MENLLASPTVTRVMTISSVALSALAHLQILPVMPLVFIKSRVFTFPPQAWRLITSFLLTGGGFSIILDPYFLFLYGSALQNESPRFAEPSDFLTYVIFVCSVILIFAGLVFHGVVFLQPFLLALAYTYSQEFPDRQVAIMAFILQVRYIPFAMLFITLVTSGPQPAIMQGTGLVAAHLYEFLTSIWPELGGGIKMIQTPEIFRRVFSSTQSRGTRVGFGTTSFHGQSQTIRNHASGAAGVGTLYSRTSGIDGSSNGSWNHRGPGRRLGGD